ncbi:MAG: ribose 5-phosphate isomerase B [Muriicola sp.]|nr:ribose 5-phosphate isomerase B [Muriicola sp.]NNK11125.1 ribose 5-phosphate isomerase B [Flavobacteriaceae bacterium]
MKIAIGNDHAGTEYKLAVVGLLKSLDIEVFNHGTDDSDSVDYPDFVHPVAKDVEDGKVDIGIIICGSGNGASMTANKHQNIRAALCWNKEITELARAHNDANILSLPARFISLHQALDMVRTFLNTPFDGGRHERRIEKIACS